MILAHLKTLCVVVLLILLTYLLYDSAGFFKSLCKVRQVYSGIYLKNGLAK